MFYVFCFLFSLLSETKTFRLWTDKVIEYVAFSTKTFSIELCSYVPDRNINTDLSSCSTKLFKGQKHNQAIVSSAQACTCYQITLYVFKYVKIMLFWSCCDLPLNKKRSMIFFLEKCGLFLTSQTKRFRVWMSIWWFLLGILFSSSF